jgi:hypothetical protein
MDKKLLDKLNGFNLSMQQKMQLVELIKEAGGGSSRNDFVISLEDVEEDGDINIYYNFNGKYRAKGHTKSTQYDTPTITNTEIYNYCLENMTSNIIVDSGILKVPGYIAICNYDGSSNQPSLCLVIMGAFLDGGSGSVLSAEAKIITMVIIEASNEN